MCAPVITGAGLATPAGLSLAETWQAIASGRSAIGPPRRTEPYRAVCPSAAEVRPFALAGQLRVAKHEKYAGPAVACALRAAAEAMAQAGAGAPVTDPGRLGIYTGTGQTGLDVEEFFPALTAAWSEDPTLDFRGLGGRAARLVDPHFSLRTLANGAAALLAIELDAHGPSLNVVQGETAGALVLEAASDDLADGRCDVALVCACDSLLTPSTLAAYARAGLLSTLAPDRAGRPFTAGRDGLVPGEGAGAVVLERAKDAFRCGTSPLGVLAGVGVVSSLQSTAVVDIAACDRAVGLVAARAVEPPALVVARGIATAPDDAAEAAWLARRFGPSVPVTAFKGLTGYLGAATAVVEAVLALAALRAGVGPAVTARIDPAVDGASGLVAGRPAPIAGRGSEAVCLSWSWTGQAAAVAVRAPTR